MSDSSPHLRVSLITNLTGTIHIFIGGIKQQSSQIAKKGNIVVNKSFFPTTDIVTQSINVDEAKNDDETWNPPTFSQGNTIIGKKRDFDEADIDKKEDRYIAIEPPNKKQRIMNGQSLITYQKTGNKKFELG
eukprot:130939_1